MKWESMVSQATLKIRGEEGLSGAASWQTEASRVYVSNQRNLQIGKNKKKSCYEPPEGTREKRRPTNNASREEARGADLGEERPARRVGGARGSPSGRDGTRGDRQGAASADAARAARSSAQGRARLQRNAMQRNGQPGAARDSAFPRRCTDGEQGLLGRLRN